MKDSQGVPEGFVRLAASTRLTSHPDRVADFRNVVKPDCDPPTCNRRSTA